MNDTPGQVATGRDSIYSLNVEEAAALYARAGHPRTVRTVQRYCASKHLDSVRETTMLGDRYFIEPGSVARHISQIEELIALDTRASGRDASRPVAAIVAHDFHDASEQPQPTGTDMSSPVAHGRAPEHLSETGGDTARPEPTQAPSLSRPVATSDADASRYVAGLEREVERALEDRDFLRDQIKTKDKQIESLLERDRETNVLVRTLQQMLSPLLGSARREPPEEGSRPQF